MKGNVYIRGFKIILLYSFFEYDKSCNGLFQIKEHFDLKNAGALLFWKCYPRERRNPRGEVFLILLIPLAPLHMICTLEKSHTGKFSPWSASTVDIMALSSPVSGCSGLTPASN